MRNIILACGVPKHNTGARDVAELTTGHILLFCMHVVSNVLQVVIAVILTPVQHKCRMQFLTSAPNFKGSADPLTRPSRVPDN